MAYQKPEIEIAYVIIVDGNTISNTKTMFLRIASTMEHQPTVKTNSIYAKCTITGQKPEVEIAYAIFEIEMRFQILKTCF